jgi:hypothetical protein
MIDWQEIYNRFLQERRTIKLEEVTHRHHIVPRHEQGSDREDNLVRLSVKDHATAHWLRYKWLGKLQDKVAWLMLSGKTVEGERLRVQLAFEKYTIEDRRQVMKENNPMYNSKSIKKSLETRRQKYSGNYHSQQGLENMRTLNNTGGQHTPEAIEKRKQSLKQTLDALGEEGRREKYARVGESNGNFGTKRPGELAGNYGKSKGKYIIIHPDKSQEVFDNLKEALEKYDEGTLKRNRNTEVSIKGGKLKGCIIIYEENINYGNNKNQIK